MITCIVIKSHTEIVLGIEPKISYNAGERDVTKHLKLIIYSMTQDAWLILLCTCSVELDMVFESADIIHHVRYVRLLL